MQDKELLELAAKAAGIDSRRLPDAWPDRFDDDQWNPLIDDGDALRLAVKLDLCVTPYPVYENPKHSVIAEVKQHRYDYDKHKYGPIPAQVVEPHNNDPHAATRRAIVRAAAEIGKQLNAVAQREP